MSLMTRLLIFSTTIFFLNSSQAITVATEGGGSAPSENKTGPVKVVKEGDSGAYYANLSPADSDFLETTHLTCVFEGIKKATYGKSLYDLDPSVKWLALLATGAQEYYQVSNNYVSSGGMSATSRKNFEKQGVSSPQDQFRIKMIQMIQAYGYCGENKLNQNAEITDKPGMGPIRSETKVSSGLFSSKKIDERKILLPLTSGSLKDSPTGKDQKQYENALSDAIKIYGFKNADTFKDLFSPSEEWSKMSVADRRDHFNNYLDHLVDSSTNSDGAVYAGNLNSSSDEAARMKNCFDDIKILQKRSSFFQVKGEYSKNNMALCESMAQSCELSKQICLGADTFKKEKSSPAGETIKPSQTDRKQSVGDMPAGSK